MRYLLVLRQPRLGFKARSSQFHACASNHISIQLILLATCLSPPRAQHDSTHRLRDWKSLDSTVNMQRNNYGQPPPAMSPPLHHPVPQHVSTVPQLRSPPPPMPQQSQHSSYGNPYQSSHPPPGGQNTFGAYGGFINDPTAQMGFQVGQTAFKHGTEYMEQNVGS